MHVLPFKPSREENKTNSGMPEALVLQKAELPVSATASWMNDSDNRTDWSSLSKQPSKLRRSIDNGISGIPQFIHEAKNWKLSRFLFNQKYLSKVKLFKKKQLAIFPGINVFKKLILLFCLCVCGHDSLLFKVDTPRGDQVSCVSWKIQSCRRNTHLALLF